jgi:hypothetical protein
MNVDDKNRSVDVKKRRNTAKPIQIVEGVEVVIIGIINRICRVTEENLIPSQS